MIAATIGISDTSNAVWDVVVIGAGPAGALAARECARRGMATLLVDRSRFPRSKVCGCCVNARARAALAQAGLETLLDREGAVSLHAFHVASRGRVAEVGLPEGYVSLSRARLDAALVREAIHAGSQWLPGVKAAWGEAVGEAREIHLQSVGDACTTSGRRDASTRTLHANVVLDATGLGGEVVEGSRIGIGTILGTPHEAYVPGITYMACGQRGYLGLQRLEDGRLDVAAAVDAAWLRTVGGPRGAAEQVMAEAGFPPLDFEAASWKGTAPLTRRASPVAAPRVFALGDAAGYVEPFTGEGIAWALSTALTAGPIAARAAARYDETHERAWQSCHRELVTRRQWICKAMAAGLRRPSLVSMGVRAVAALPILARPLVWQINHAPSHAAASPYSA